MKIYSCNLTQITQHELDEWFDSMSKDRKEAVMRLKVEDKRKSKIAADHLCRLAISEFCGVSPESIMFSFAEKGKPYAAGLDIFFNISHSGDIIACAVSDKEIGIDIEKIRPFNLKTAEKFAVADEIEHIKSMENGFFEIWTLKEAYFKCIGTGLGADIKNVSFRIKKNKIHCSAHGFECDFHNIADGYICSTCQKTQR